MNGRAPRNSGTATEFAFINFDLDADLSSLFNWNTKQVFAYLVAEYSTPKYGSNAVTLWDRIINTPEEADLQLYSASQKYRFNEITGNFRHVNATYALRWNVVPWVGLMGWGKGVDGSIALHQSASDSEP
jgi:signal peptidase complex subunit 3